MDKTEFVSVLKENIREDLIRNTVSFIKSPPGRQPDKEIIKLSNWYNNLSGIDKDNFLKIVGFTVDNSIFEMLCIIDGVRVVEDTIDKGEFELYFNKYGNKELLNTQDGQYLHDLYNLK